MAGQRLLKPRDAAQVLGISYSALKQWIYKRKLRTVKTAGGHHRIPESELDKYLFKASEGSEAATRRTGFRRSY
jgi:excisionase family DNA binding protein